jgi:TrmH family RNA methyltransferase
MLAASVPLEQAGGGRPAGPWSLIFGNEGAGLPPEFSRMGQPVRIPSSTEIDSLNLAVAAAVGIYVFTRP